MGHGALAAECSLEKRSFKFRSENTDGCKVTNRVRKAIPDLRVSGALREEKTDFKRGTFSKLRSEERSDRGGW